MNATTNWMKDYVEERLLKWAHWGKHANIRLGYPSQSVEARMMKGTSYTGAKFRFFALNEDNNPEAEEMDKLISNLYQYDTSVAIAIKVNYLDSGSQSFKAKKMGISISQFKTKINVGKAWLSGCLAVSFPENESLFSQGANLKPKIKK